MTTEQFEYVSTEETQTEESKTERQEESQKIEKTKRERLQKDRYIKKTIDFNKDTEKKLIALTSFYKLNQRQTLDLIITSIYKEKIKEEKQKYKETLEEQVRRLLNERNEIMANQAELLNRFIDLQKEVDNKIDSRFTIESAKTEARLADYKLTLDDHYRKICTTINNHRLGELRAVVNENGKRLDKTERDIKRLDDTKASKIFK